MNVRSSSQKKSQKSLGIKSGNTPHHQIMDSFNANTSKDPYIPKQQSQIIHPSTLKTALASEKKNIHFSGTGVYKGLSTQQKNYQKDQVRLSSFVSPNKYSIKNAKTVHNKEKENLTESH